jgi:hypothetical protein
MAAAISTKELHANSKIEEVVLSRLQVDYTYQRDPSEALVDSIAEDWDTVASELILVSDRGARNGQEEVKGGLFIVNGQHRTKAAAKLGHKTIHARVIDLKKVTDPGEVEAGFRLKTNVRLGDRPLERFKAQVRAGDEESLAIVELLTHYGTEINSQPQQEIGINCVATIEALYRIDDGSLLGDTLDVIKTTWGYAGGKFSHAAMLKGIAWFIEKHADDSDRDRLVGKMKGVGMAPLESRARTIGLTMGGSLWVNYYRALVDLYNEQLREKNRLQWMLRGSRTLANRGGGKALSTPTA